MTVLRGLNHVGVRTADLDRFELFYRTTFGARVLRENTDGGVRNALIDVGGGFLHVFLVAGDDMPDPDRPGTRSGRLDHFALEVPTRSAFLDVRHRLMDAGRSDGVVRDGGAVWSLKYRDPDGFECELVWTVDPHAWSSAPPRILAEADLAATGPEVVPEPPDLGGGRGSTGGTAWRPA